MLKKKILIVEDDADVRLGLHVFLKAHHFDTFVAADGQATLSEARKHQPDLIILDLGLPAGDGFVVLDRLRALSNLALTPVVVVSARSVHVNKERALAAGARAYIQKPWNDTELLATITHLIGPSDLSSMFA